MLWHEDIPVWKSKDQKASVTVWAGHYFEATEEHATAKIPKDSWAKDPANDVAILHIRLDPGGKLILPKAHGGAEINRSLFYVEGERGMSVDGKDIGEKVVLTIQPDVDVELALSESAEKPGEFLLLQGKPINEPVSQYGPFVMNTEAEINQAFSDYQRTKFGGWPWPDDAMVFPKEKGRFALIQGKEIIAGECSQQESPL